MSLAIYVRRDDAALEALVAHLADEVHTDWSAIASSSRLKALTQLVALRTPVAVPYLQSLIKHPDPEVWMRVRRALELHD